MDIESSGTRPFHEVERPFVAEGADELAAMEAKRELTIANPDSPIVACSQFTQAPGKTIAAGEVKGVTYNLGKSAGCLQYNYEVTLNVTLTLTCSITTWSGPSR